MELSSGVKMWIDRDVFHRRGAPAIERIGDRTDEWWVRGSRLFPKKDKD